MKLKKAILTVLGRDSLKAIVTDLEIDGVDLRSVTEMSAVVSRAHRATPEVLLEYLGEPDVKAVCEIVGVNSTGRRKALIKKLLRNAAKARPARRPKTGTTKQVSATKRKTVSKESTMNEQDAVPEPVTRLPEPPPGMFRMTKPELVWPGKYDEHGKRSMAPRVNLPFQVIETINESRATRESEKEHGLLFDFYKGSEGSTFEAGWKNKLIWGDNLLVMGSLLERFAGKIDLIYIDPPFATGADFSISSEIGESRESVTKEQSAIEEKAYRDTWGSGTSSYLKMIHERLLLMRELLSETGSIYVHIDYRLVAQLRLVLDEVFGPSRFVNEIIWKRGNHKLTEKMFLISHDNILFYSKSDSYEFNPQFGPYDKDYIEKYYCNVDPDGRRYQVQGMYGKGAGPAMRFGDKVIAPPKGLHWRWTQERIDDAFEKGIIVFPRGGQGMPRFKDYLDDKQGVPVRTIWDDVYEVNSQAAERLDYPTQKPESLLSRIIEASSSEGGLVADFFCGSGTALAAAEKLGRRWIGCDLGRFAVHTTRKRMLGTENCHPFEILNLGKYERQYWQGVTFGDKKGPTEEKTLFEYLAFILRLYGAQPVPGLQHIHGKKGRALVHIGAVDAPVTIDEANAAIAECLQATQKELHILGWEWEMGLNDLMLGEAKRQGLKLVLMQIPREVMVEQAAAKGDGQFFELGFLEADIRDLKNLKAEVSLRDFVIPNTELIPEVVRAKVKKWSDYIDYWAVDWSFQNDTFMQGWVTYRTRKDRTLALKSDPHTYDKPGKHKVLVKVVDIFGNDTTQAYDVEVK